MVEYAKKFCLSGHAQAVQGVAVFPKGDRMISVGDDQRLILWSLQTGKQIFACAGHRGPITTVLVFGDGSKVITGSLDRNAIIWDVDAEKPLQMHVKLEGNAGSITSLAVLPGTGIPARAMPKLAGIRASGRAPDAIGGVPVGGGDRVITGSSDAMVISWNADTGQVIDTVAEHHGAITSMAVFPQGGQVISGSCDKTAKIWTCDGAIVRKLQHNAKVNAVGVLKDGEKVITGSANGKIIVWDCATGEEVFTFPGKDQPIRSLSVFPFDDKVLSGGDDKTVCLWDIETGKKLQKFTEHTDCVSSVAVAPGETVFVTAGGGVDKNVIVWEGAASCSCSIA